MIVYHGTDSYSAQNIIQNGIDLTYGEKSVDNARGFYTTPSLEFATRRAKMVTASARGFRKDDELKAVVLQIEIDENLFNRLHIKEFVGCTYEWKEFIFYNRIGKRFLTGQGISSDNHNLDGKYDIVIDETADAGIGSLVSKIRYKETRSGADLKSVIGKIKKSDDKSWGKQISFHSKRSLRMCVKSIKTIEV